MFTDYTGSDWVQLVMYIVMVASIIAVGQVLAGILGSWINAKRLQRRLRKQYPNMQITVEPSDRRYKDGESDITTTEFLPDTGKWKQTTTSVRMFDHNPEAGSHERIDE